MGCNLGIYEGPEIVRGNAFKIHVNLDAKDADGATTPLLVNEDTIVTIVGWTKRYEIQRTIHEGYIEANVDLDLPVGIYNVEVYGTTSVGTKFRVYGRNSFQIIEAQEDSTSPTIDANTDITIELSLVAYIGPKGDAFTYDDFTEEQIIELQKPALEAAAIASDASTKALDAANKAMNAVDKANDASAYATLSASSANDAADNAIDASEMATNSSNIAIISADKADAAALAALSASSSAEKSTEKANNASMKAELSAEKADEATAEAKAVIERAKEAANSALSASGIATSAADSANNAATDAVNATISANAEASKANKASIQAADAANYAIAKTNEVSEYVHAETSSLIKDAESSIMTLEDNVCDVITEADQTIEYVTQSVMELTNSKQKMVDAINGLNLGVEASMSDTLDVLSQKISLLPAIPQWEHIETRCQRGWNRAENIITNTGKVQRIYRDVNPNSPTYMQEFVKTGEEDLVMCPIPDVSGIISITWKRCNSSNVISEIQTGGENYDDVLNAIFSRFKPCTITEDGDIKYIDRDSEKLGKYEDGTDVDYTSELLNGRYCQHMVQFADFYISYYPILSLQDDTSCIQISLHPFTNSFHVRGDQYIGMFRGIEMNGMGISVAATDSMKGKNANYYVQRCHAFGEEYHAAHVLQRSILYILHAFAHKTFNTEINYPHPKTDNSTDGIVTGGFGQGQNNRYMFCFVENAFGYVKSSNSGEIMTGIYHDQDYWIRAISNYEQFVTTEDDPKIMYQSDSRGIMEWENIFYFAGTSGGGTSTGKYDSAQYTSPNTVGYYGGGLDVSGSSAGGGAVFGNGGAGSGAGNFACRPSRWAKGTTPIEPLPTNDKLPKPIDEVP